MYTDEELFKKDLYHYIDDTISAQRPWAYCGIGIHKGYLTHEMVIKKNCKNKSCNYYRENSLHPEIQRKQHLKALLKAKRKGKATYTFQGKTYLTTRDNI